MPRERTAIDKLADSAVDVVVGKSEQRGTYFFKEEIVTELMTRRNLLNVLTEIRNRYRGWNLYEMLIRQIETTIGHALQKRDVNGIRIYECYSTPGDSRRRWMRTRSLTTDTLRAVMEQTRTKEREMHVKGERYEIALYHMENLEKQTGKKVRFGEVYDEVVPLMRSAS